jgi:hypothetical protein
VSRGFRYGFDIMDASGLASGTVYPFSAASRTPMLRSRWEATASAHDEQRPPRRYYQVTGAGTAPSATPLLGFPVSPVRSAAESPLPA